jgi:[glutamine synthetase] adenylyltransferase / [glutamine synthetase]-adenylyl-L-tyrosine phosphorylase
MSAFSFQSSALPMPFDRARAERTLDRLADAGYRPEGPALALLKSAFGNSPYLCRLALRNTAMLQRLFEEGPEILLDEAFAEALAAGGAADEAAAMKILRAAKARAALTVALCDIAGYWALENTTRALTGLAEAALKGAVRFALRTAARNTERAGKSGAELETSTGMTFLAMGKFGSGELNYSSDIDIIVFFDAEGFPFRRLFNARTAAVDIVKHVVRLIGEITADGYVFRVDLRLRPDAGSTQVAISLDAAAEYYEEMGQNWERAAMIKARSAAGDPHTGARFLELIEPFVWRRSLDFAAIEDIHSIKRQIHAQNGGAEIAVAGHNIKLGRGGIREIEFFVQTQQLILGGRDPSLREPVTLRALEALAARGVVSSAAARDLAKAYRFLRTLEHRLQMIEDEQTHTIAKSKEGVAHIACFMGYAGTAEFSGALVRELETVQDHYARLFEREAPLASEGNLVFTGVEDDPDTLATLEKMGFRDPAHISGAIRGWHHGSIRATRSQRAREILTKLIPALLAALAKSADPDAAFAQFDRFITNLPAGVQLFSLLLAHSELLQMIANVMGSAPRLAQHLSHSPAALNAMLDPEFLGPLSGRTELAKTLRDRLIRAGDYEKVLDEARRFVHEQIFRIGVQVIEGAANADAAGPAFAAVAESAIAGLLPYVEDKLSETAGRIPGGAFAVIAMGKLGGREMTAGSDLDLVFVYDTPAGVDESDGIKPLPVIVYYARLAQRFIAALTAMTSEGGLYEVDMRLRPTGNKGPAAVSLDSFRRYHETEAWTWERLAMTRARIVIGPPALTLTLVAAISNALCKPQDWAKLSGDAREMRAKVASQYPGKSPWDIKYAPGGLMDIEFVAQTMQLRYAPKNPELLTPNTIDALQRLALAGVMADGDARILITAARLQHALTQALRIALDGTLAPQTATSGLKALLARAGEISDFDKLQDLLADLQGRAHAVFDRVLAE